MSFWEQHSRTFLIIAFVLLVLVLLPGLGHRVNGSKRWVGIGPLTLQVSEFVKFAFIVYLASYLVRHQQEVQTEVPLSEMFGYATDVRSLTEGRATFTMEFSTYSDVPQHIYEKMKLEEA